MESRSVLMVRSICLWLLPLDLEVDTRAIAHRELSLTRVTATRLTGPGCSSGFDGRWVLFVPYNKDWRAVGVVSKH